MKRTILVLQNDQLSPLGVFEAALVDRNFSIETRHPISRPETLPESIDGFAGIIVLGGAVCALDDGKFPGIKRALSLLNSAAATGVPILGICLGGQLLARALGGKVYRNASGEVGMTVIDRTPDGDRDPLLAGIEPFISMEMHFDCFAVPPGGTLLATSARCAAQAFRFGETAWGLQFHPEVTPCIIAGWSTYLRNTSEQSSVEHATQLTRDLQSGITDSMEVGRIISARWSDIVAHGPVFTN
jgi:GMP synthase (glutamine-hydrolysing)